MDRHLRKLAREDEEIRFNGAKRCKAKGPYSCERLVDHDGCHFAHIPLVTKTGKVLEGSRGGGTAYWADKGQRLLSPYPKRRIKS